MYITCQLDWYIYMEMYNLSLSVIGQKVKKKSPGFEPGYVPEDGSLIDHIDLEPRWGMDLRGLKGSKEGPGQHKGGGRKEDLKKSYKKPGTSTDEARSLRTIYPWLGLQIHGCDFSEVSTSWLTAPPRWMSWSRSGLRWRSATTRRIRVAENWTQVSRVSNRYSNH